MMYLSNNALRSILDISDCGDKLPFLSSVFLPPREAYRFSRIWVRIVSHLLFLPREEIRLNAGQARGRKDSLKLCYNGNPRMRNEQGEGLALRGETPWSEMPN